MTTVPIHILISRTDAIGDVTLTLPMCGYLKHLMPDAKISFLGRTYTGPVIASCKSIDEFINYDEIRILDSASQIDLLRSKTFDVILHVYPNKKIAYLAIRAGISMRVGTINRAYHWFTCNKLIRLSRRDSSLHEAQLNMIFLKAFGLKKIPSVKELAKYYNFKAAFRLPDKFIKMLDNEKFKLIIHPKSHGSGKEWRLSNFRKLIEYLPKQQFQVFITGSENEKTILKSWIKLLPEHVIDLTGEMTLNELISFISSADGLVAASTGPLHLAAFSGIRCLGLFPKGRAINAQRWAPVGKHAEFIEGPDDDLNTIKPEEVYQKLKAWRN